MKTLLAALSLLVLTLDAQGREFGERVSEVGDLVVAAIADGEGRPPPLDVSRCVEGGDETTCVFRFNRDVWFEAVGDNSGLVNFITFYAVPNDLREKTGTSFALLTAAFATFSFEYRGNWQLASAAAGDLVDAASRDGYSQVSINGREFAFDADGTLTVFISEGDECDGCDEQATDAEGAIDGEVEAAEVPEERPPAETVGRVPTRTSEIGPNFTLVVQSKVVVDLCGQSGFPTNTGISDAIEGVFEAAQNRGIDPQKLKIEADNMDAYAMALVTLPYILVDPAERGRSEMMCDQAGQAAKLASPIAISEVESFR